VKAKLTLLVVNDPHPRAAGDGGGLVMLLVTSRRTMLLAVTLVSAVLVAGCHGKAIKSSASATATTSTASATPAVPTSSGPPPLTRKERVWLTAVDTLAKKAEKAVTGKTSEFVTRAKLQSDASVLRGYSRDLQRLGLPGGRLQPVSVLLKNARRQFDKAVACYTTAAGIVSPGGAVEAGPNERRFTSAMDCAGAGEGNGLNDLLEAAAVGKEIRAESS
jgi:hypothetical protein